MPRTMSRTGLPQGLNDALGWFAGRPRWWIVILLLAGAGICLGPILLTEPPRRWLWQAADALVEERYDAAERLSLAVLDEWPECAPALVIAGEAAARLDRPADSLSCELQEPVTDVMTQSVIDLLEAVQVEQAQAHAATVAGVGGDRILHALHEELAVRQSCQRVMEGLVLLLT